MIKLSTKRVLREISDFNQNAYPKTNYSKEIRNILNNLHVYCLNCYDYKNEKIVVYVSDIKKNITLLSLDISDCYPFKPYKILYHNLPIFNKNSKFYYKTDFVNYNSDNINSNISVTWKNNSLENNIPYNKCLEILSNNKHNFKIFDSAILKFFYKLQYNFEPKFLNYPDSVCWCCSSILCGNNWSPSLRINDVIIEFLETKFILKYNQPYNYIKLITIYNGLFEVFNNYNLPDDIIDMILD